MLTENVNIQKWEYNNNVKVLWKMFALDLVWKGCAVS